MTGCKGWDNGTCLEFRASAHTQSYLPGFSASLRWALSCLLTAPWHPGPPSPPSFHLPHDHCHGRVMLTWKRPAFHHHLCPEQGPPCCMRNRTGQGPFLAIPAHCPGLAAPWGSSRVRDKALISPSQYKHILAENENFGGRHWPRAGEGRPWAGV